MGITHAQPLLVLLIGSPFFLSVLGKVVEFETCEDRLYPVNVTTVDISPYPFSRLSNGNITITGVTSVDIPSNVSVAALLRNQGAGPPNRFRTYFLCEITACPIAPGPFVLTLFNIFTYGELLTAQRGYVVQVFMDESESTTDMRKMCAWFSCPVKTIL